MSSTSKGSTEETFQKIMYDLRLASYVCFVFGDLYESMNNWYAWPARTSLKVDVDMLLLLFPLASVINAKPLFIGGICTV